MSTRKRKAIRKTAPRSGAVLRISFLFFVDIRYFLYTLISKIEPERGPRENVAYSSGNPAGLRREASV